MGTVIKVSFSQRREGGPDTSKPRIEFDGYPREPDFEGITFDQAIEIHRLFQSYDEGLSVPAIAARLKLPEKIVIRTLCGEIFPAARSRWYDE